MFSFCSRHSNSHTLGITHLSHHDHIGRLPNCGPQCRRKIWSIRANLHLLNWCSYSIGSSTMAMCRASFWLISLTRAANVVDFPDPAGPPTRAKPRVNRAWERTEDGRCKASKVGTDEGRARIAAAAGLPRSLCKFIRNLPNPLTQYEDPQFQWHDNSSTRAVLRLGGQLLQSLFRSKYALRASLPDPRKARMLAHRERAVDRFHPQ